MYLWVLIHISAIKHINANCRKLILLYSIKFFISDCSRRRPATDVDLISLVLVSGWRCMRLCKWRCSRAGPGHLSLLHQPRGLSLSDLSGSISSLFRSPSSPSLSSLCPLLTVRILVMLLLYLPLLVAHSF